MAVGQSVLRKEGYEKLAVAERYVDDITIEGMLFDTTVLIYILQGRINMITLVPRRLNQS
jgi:CO/xanthine dehydrogenase Mo-binding subunit